MPQLKRVGRHEGTVEGKLKLGGLLYFDLSSYGVAFDQGVKRLASEIRLISADGVGGGGVGGAGHPVYRDFLNLY